MGLVYQTESKLILFSYGPTGVAAATTIVCLSPEPWLSARCLFFKVFSAYTTPNGPGSWYQEF
jgi:hypothetical protein